MILLLILIIIICLSIIFVKDINPQIKAVCRNILIMVSILLVVIVLIGLVGFLVAQRSNAFKLNNNIDYMLASPQNQE
jgi:hypothetical protein